ncbi:N-formylglutamate amidohydrolase [Rhodoblastus acidophilus]|uniref:N-formylglutamate amidohydrolase n=1 Tax=Candidatus Rhodoblastus alkanivorans TaxID=2954117 RepID=A0ABS9ZBP0_9HYPH|nr:N-formylglutamate amidohydrolase [Candidatus Rhodoblastus alkanivorans]MCI4679355.1 N-formylglutamate amidohydrolase [Candidatus Rhodoblastus alkanivorans]MCI4684831.1 N-formylglutamate amidohydrolase [Candidatus Rhodoblastus alkanivorans]
MSLTLKIPHNDSSPGAEPAFRPFDLIAGAADQRLILFCDHASNALPPAYGDLGLCREALGRHIAFDIGAEKVVRRLAALTGAAAALALFSRLLIDPNRGEDDPTLVMRISDGALIPGNARIGEEEIARRVETYWRPYRAACAGLIDSALARGQIPVLIGIHSFTPCFQGCARRWQAGVLWDKDPRLALPLIEGLRAENIVVGDNEPYDGALLGDSMYEHSTRRGLPGALIEIRQDLLETPAHCEAWAERLARVVAPILSRAETRGIEFFGSRADPKISSA